MLLRSTAHSRRFSIHRVILRLEELETRQQPAVVVSVDAAADRHAINPMIYGVAFADTAALNDLNVPYNRSGGNAETRYNWQLNASNRASDWYFESLPDSSATPGATADSFVASTKSAGAQATLTIPTIGWVANLGPSRTRLASFPASVYPSQTGYDPYWSTAGNGMNAAGPITGNDATLANRTADPNFQRAWIQHLISTWGTAANGGVRYYTLDNEPSIWYSTHRDVHPNGASMDEIFNDIVNYSAMIKSVDPGALTVGPEEWGWSGYFYSGKDQQYGSQTGDWGHLPDRTAHGGADYLPWVLQQLRSYDQAHGTHSLDVFSLHYYPQGGEFSDTVSNSMQLQRNRSTRSLWDPTYVDQSWIGSAGPDNGIVRLIPRLKQWVSTYYPGLQTGVTEYNWGAEGHMNGATTQADILGIFGREGLDLANRWTTPAAGTPTYQAIKMYRNYDGNKSTFGDTGVRATVPNPDQVSVFAATRADGALTVMVINKNLYDPANPGATTSITVNLSNFANRGTAQLWRLAATNPANLTVAGITHLSDLTFTANSFSINAPMQSVQLFVIPAAATAPAVANVQIGDGSIQRSMVRSLAVTFSGLVVLDPGAFTVIRNDGVGTTVGFTTATVGGRTVATLTFSGTGTALAGSLADGLWTLTVTAAKVRDAGTPSLTMTADQTAAFHRLFGDANGDRVVNQSDLTLFRAAYGSGDATFDVDGNGVVDANDLAAFRANYGFGV
jgi:hypothetical protein